MILGWWDIPLVVVALYVAGVKVWAKAQERDPVEVAVRSFVNFLEDELGSGPARKRRRR